MIMAKQFPPALMQQVVLNYTLPVAGRIKKPDLTIIFDNIYSMSLLRKESISENVLGQIFNKSFKNFFFLQF